MISQLRLRTSSHVEKDGCTPVGFLLDYEDPKCLKTFSEPPVFRAARLFTNHHCQTVNYQLVFVSLSGEELVYHTGYVKRSVIEGEIEFHESNGNVYEILVGKFDSFNGYLFSQSSLVGMPIQIPLLPRRRDEALVWDYSRMVCDAANCSRIRILQEWLGFLALVHAPSTIFIMEATIRKTLFCDKDLQTGKDRKHARIPLTSSWVPSTSLLWVYYSTPKPFCLRTFLCELLSGSDWDEELARLVERFSPRHEGFYKAALVEKEGRTSISFDYGEESLFELQVRRVAVPAIANGVSARKTYGTLVYFYQPISFDAFTSPTNKIPLGFFSTSKYVPLSMLPGDLPEENIISFGVIRSELNELWSRIWHKNYTKPHSEATGTIQAVLDDGYENLLHLPSLAKF